GDLWRLASPRPRRSLVAACLRWFPETGIHRGGRAIRSVEHGFSNSMIDNRRKKPPVARPAALSNSRRSTRLAPSHRGARPKGPGKGIETALHGFAEKQAVLRWDLEDQIAGVEPEPSL